MLNKIFGGKKQEHKSDFVIEDDDNEEGKQNSAYVNIFAYNRFNSS